MLPPLEKKTDVFSIVEIDKKSKKEKKHRRKTNPPHSDTNKSEEMPTNFLQLSSAYKILADPDKKSAYDTLKNYDDEKDEVYSCSMCKTKSHNLRFVIFKEVTNKNFHISLKTIQGVYCLKCANITAVRASMRTCLFGFWFFPFGTFLSISAILNNINGGKKPKKLNSRLLINHAKSLITRREFEKAKFIANEALKFTKVLAQVKNIKVILERLENIKSKKDKWSKFNSAFFIQISPFVMFLFLFSSIIFYSQRVEKSVAIVEQESLKIIALPDNPLDDNLIYIVKSDNIKVYQGPSFEFGIIKTISKGSKVRIIGLVPRTLWVKVRIGDIEGFVISEFLTKFVER